MALVVVAVLARNWLASPDIKMLVPEHGAQWIHQRRAFDLRAWGPTQEVVFFRKKVRVPAGVESAVVTVRALRTCMVYWDQKDRVLVAAKPNEWKEPHLVDLKKLTPGEHTLDVFVENSYGPAACLVYCDALDLRSGPDWEQNVYGEKWLPAATVDDVEPPPLEKPVASPLRALAKELWWLGPLFLAVFAVCLWSTRNRAGDGQPDEAVECLALPMDRDCRVARVGGQQLPQAAAPIWATTRRRTSITSISWPSGANFPMPRTGGRCFRRRCFTSWRRSSIAA